ncbi:MAG: hypothetical protein LBQ31_04385, partial [Bacteroidales bacterium]|nr:hypothetical protein [Bacteroidales bacterium]
MKKYFITIAMALLLANTQAKVPTLNAKENYLCVSLSGQRDGCRHEISGFDDGESFTVPVYSPRNKYLQVTFYTDIDSLVCKMDDYADFKFNLKIAELKDPNEICVHFTNQLPNKISNVEKIYALSMIWNEVRYNFAFYDELDFDFDSLYRTYIPTVLETGNDIEFYNALERFMATLKDGHTHTVSNYDAYMGRLPLDFKVFQQELYVTGIYKSDGGTIPLGSKVLKINDIPCKQYIEREVLPYIIVKNPYMVENEIAYRICSSKLISDSLSFTVQLPDKQIRTYNKHFYAQLQDEGEHLKSRKTDRWTPMNLSWLKDSIAVLT